MIFVMRPHLRLFEKDFNPVEIATITGHKDPRMLMRYTRLRAEDLARELLSVCNSGLNWWAVQT